ncbi:unnamed protein product [Ambrosiozyma monospora]|uniref:Unnamed protein product n=1 Tax=Ambrosiozyma monospora TaxID=43982 RepID=A0ACB5TDC8_AMBMO|nr:unnamed protein product [Ambrosiozyma monospora]
MELIHYKSQFHTFGNLGLSQKIVEKLRNFTSANDGGDAVFKNAKLTTRGFDHGLWVPLRVAFGDTKVSDTQKYDVDVPMVQVSLPRSSQMETSYRLGQALSWIRDVGGLLIFSGMSVHNLRDMGVAFQLMKQGGAGLSLSYVDPFNRVLTRQLTSKLGGGDKADGDARLKQLLQIEQNDTWRKLYVASHPTNEHFLPVVVGAGASRGDACTELYTAGSGSLGWNLYQWGTSDSGSKAEGVSSSL